jgi:hypothetical protein
VNSLALSFILFAGASAGALAASVQELRWSELAPLVAGKRVEISLVDGSRVKGEALAVRDDTLVMDIRGSSGPTRFSKGRPSTADTSQFDQSRTGERCPAYAIFRVDGGAQALAAFIGIVVGATAGGTI